MITAILTIKLVALGVLTLCAAYPFYLTLKWRSVL